MCKLFEPFALRGVEFRNRLGLSPMCTYSCEGMDGLAGAWHVVHYGSRAAGGFGMVIVEATAVRPEGRITPYDLGLWSDSQAEALAPVAHVCTRLGAVAGVQLAHAGRQACSHRPWSSKRGRVTLEEGGWDKLLAPSPVPHSEGKPVPAEMTVQDIREVVDSFRDAARRSLEAGFQFVEVHGAHGYLQHQFLSPLSNHRSDSYGGGYTGRTKLMKETVAAIREVWPERLPLLVRLSATDYIRGGWDIEQSVELAKELKLLGVDLVDCSSGGANSNSYPPTRGPGYQLPLAERLRNSASIPVAAVGNLDDPSLAQEAVASGKTDLVLVGQKALVDPYWPCRVALELGCPPPWAVAYGWALMR